MGARTPRWFRKERRLEAHVYCRGGEIYSCAVSSNVDGLGFLAPPFLSLPGSAPDAELGSMARRSAQGSRTGLPRAPREEREWLSQPLLDLAGVRSFRTFERTATSASVEWSGRSLLVTPMRRVKGGFQSDPREAVPVPIDDDGALGAALRAALLGA